jgi:hypothetical protein
VAEKLRKKYSSVSSLPPLSKTHHYLSVMESFKSFSKQKFPSTGKRLWRIAVVIVISKRANFAFAKWPLLIKTDLSLHCHFIPE